ncbi:Clp protease ClpS, partial [Fischerella thermalis CCMEE 5196]
MITKLSAAVYAMAATPTIAPERSTQVTRKPYPNYK